MTLAFVGEYRRINQLLKLEKELSELINQNQTLEMQVLQDEFNFEMFKMRTFNKIIDVLHENPRCNRLDTADKSIETVKTRRRSQLLAKVIDEGLAKLYYEIPYAPVVVLFRRTFLGSALPIILLLVGSLVFHFMFSKFISSAK